MTSLTIILKIEKEKTLVLIRQRGAGWSKPLLLPMQQNQSFSWWSPSGSTCTHYVIQFLNIIWNTVCSILSLSILTTFLIIFKLFLKNMTSFLIFRTIMGLYLNASLISYETVHEISNNVECGTSKASDQPAHTRSLIRAFASPLSILWFLSYWLNIIWSS